MEWPEQWTRSVLPPLGVEDLSPRAILHFGKPVNDSLVEHRIARMTVAPLATAGGASAARFDEAHRPIRDFHLNNPASNPASANVTDWTLPCGN